MNKIIISNPEDFEEKKKSIISGGADKLHIISDFDRTLTKAFVEGVKSPTVIAQIRNGGYLGEDYVKKAHELFDIYHPIEINPKLDTDTKNKKMHEWWKKHFDLLIEKGINITLMTEIVKFSDIKFRDGVLDFIDVVSSKGIPLVIMSAGPGDMILEYLKKNNKLLSNVYVIANMYNFDSGGKAINVKEPIIHSMNKKEIAVKEFPIFDRIENRKNVILLGDGLADVDMVEGFECDNLIKIGFLNENVEANLERFKEIYDVVLLDDGDFGFVNDLIKEI